MTLAHFVYIPGMLLVGIVIGYVLGGRAVAAAREDRLHQDRRRAARQARREAEEGRPPTGTANPPESRANEP